VVVGLVNDYFKGQAIGFQISVINHSPAAFNLVTLALEEDTDPMDISHEESACLHH